MYEIREEDGSVTMTGERLKFYYDEHNRFSEAYSKEISYREIKIVFAKLKRHYKVSQWLRFGSRHNGHFNSSFITVPYRTSYGLVCHEVAHAIEHRKFGHTHHRKRLMRILDRVISYCRKKEWWQAELDKRLTVKVKPKPSDQEIHKARIEKRKADLLKYQKKLAYYTKLYSNKIKKARRSIAMLEKNPIGLQPATFATVARQDSTQGQTTG